MKKLRFFSLMTLILMLTHLLAPAAAAHPLGNFTINHYAGLHVTRQAVTVDYVLDMAEISAFQEIGTFDANGNGQPDPAETERYHPAQCAAIAARLDLRRDGQSLPLTVETSTLEFPAGAGGLLTLRLTCAFRSPLTEMAEAVQLEFENNAYAERLGWREIVISSDSVSLDGDLTGLTSSTSQRLTAYPR
ncbi:MAG: hypothetical protein HC875_31945 [Anaerolineales bacterium]|nr:hypothetical protein [Anaerolineales bacterium]